MQWVVRARAHCSSTTKQTAHTTCLQVHRHDDEVTRAHRRLSVSVAGDRRTSSGGIADGPCIRVDRVVDSFAAKCSKHRIEGVDVAAPVDVATADTLTE
jgi:hypothetical protein